MSKGIRGSLSSVLATLLGLLCVCVTAQGTPETRVGQAWGLGANLQFVEAGGRFGRDVSHVLHAAGRVVFFTPRGVTFAIHDSGAPESGTPESGRPESGTPESGEAAREGWAYRLAFDGRLAAPIAEEVTPTRYSYFVGDREEWACGLRAYRRLRYRDVWPDIDVVFRSAEGRLEYDVIVKPGGDVRDVRLQYEGVDVTLDGDGRLALNAGGRRFHDETPVTFQPGPDGAEPVASRYRVISSAPGRFVFGFDTASYDDERPLVVDPILPVYSGFIGGSGSEYVFDCEVDATGALYVTGSTTSSSATFPETVGPFVLAADPLDAFVAKVAPDGRSLLYCGYLGGTYPEWGYGIDVDVQGRAYVVGYTRSFNFPLWQGPSFTYQGGYDAFVCRVNAAGTTLDYSGFIGGSKKDWATDVVVDASGRAYVCGGTDSDESTFPVRGGPAKTHAGSTDGFVARVASDGRTLEFCGYVGGALADEVSAIQLDRSGGIVVVGRTGSDETTFPVRFGPDVTYNGGIDAFVARIAPDGSSVLGCGYLGGQEDDRAHGVDVDAAGNMYVVGHTRSLRTDGFPLLVGPNLTQRSRKRSTMGGFVAKVQAGFGGLDYCGYVGSKGLEMARAVAVNKRGEAYVAGYEAGSTRFLSVVGPVAPTFGKGGVFVARVAADGRAFRTIGGFGGREYDDVHGIALDTSENVYIAGYTHSSQTFPTVAGPDLTYNGATPRLDHDGFVAKFEQVVLDAPATARLGTSASLELIASGDVSRSYQIGTSFQRGPLLIGSRNVGLVPDALFVASVLGIMPQTFVNYRGVVQPDGRASALLRVAPLNSLVGLQLHSAFVTFDPSAPNGVRSISNVRSTGIVR